jgi:hypothetical protein
MMKKSVGMFLNAQYANSSAGVSKVIRTPPDIAGKLGGLTNGGLILLGVGVVNKKLYLKNSTQHTTGE